MTFVYVVNFSTEKLRNLFPPSDECICYQWSAYLGRIDLYWFFKVQSTFTLSTVLISASSSEFDAHVLKAVVYIDSSIKYDFTLIIEVVFFARAQCILSYQLFISALIFRGFNKIQSRCYTYQRICCIYIVAVVVHTAYDILLGGQWMHDD